MLRVFIILLFSGLMAQTHSIDAQTVHVKYKKFIVPGKTEYGRWMSSPAMKRRMREREEEMANSVSEYYDLHSNGRNSYFQYDTTLQTIETEEDNPWWGANNKFKESFAKDLRRGEVTLRSDLLADSVCTAWNYKEKYNWEAGEGMKVFADMRCEKMIHIDEESGDSTIAWYTPSIPISDGPEDYGGAPGLILAVEAPAYNYIAEEVAVGSFKLEKSPLAIDYCLPKKEFQELVRNERMKKYINR